MWATRSAAPAMRGHQAAIIPRNTVRSPISALRMGVTALKSPKKLKKVLKTAENVGKFRISPFFSSLGVLPAHLGKESVSGHPTEVADLSNFALGEALPKFQVASGETTENQRPCRTLHAGDLRNQSYFKDAHSKPRGDQLFQSHKTVSLQLTTSPHPQPHAHSYFIRCQMRAWGRIPSSPLPASSPNTLAPPPAAALAYAQALAVQMRQRMTRLPVTSDSIKASPHLYLPWMWHILQYVEPLAVAHVQGSKLFTMVPQCGNQAQFITITSSSVSHLRTDLMVN